MMMEDMKPATGPDMTRTKPTDFVPLQARVIELEAERLRIHNDKVDHYEARIKAEQERDAALAENARLNDIEDRLGLAVFRLERERDEARAALELILPMARGYAHQHKVGSNAEYIRTAEEALEAKHD